MGRTSGGQVVVVTKTGTNAFHGDAFEFIRNRVTDAKNYFTLPGLNPAFRRNQFGGTLGGPIIKDKTFFFINYEGLRLAQQIALQGAVPQTAWHTGDFSSLCTTGFSASGICTTASQQLVSPKTKAAYVRNQIPNSDFSPLGARLINYFPAPDVAGSSTYTLNRTRTENLTSFRACRPQVWGERHAAGAIQLVQRSFVRAVEFTLRIVGVARLRLLYESAARCWRV